MPFWSSAIVRDKALRQAIDRSLAVITFSPDGAILEANDNFLRTIGYAAHQIVGQHHRMFVDADQAASPEYRAFWKALANGHLQEGEFQRRGAGGREIWLQATYNPVRNASGRVTQIVTIATDVTAVKHRAMEDAGQIEAIHRSQAVIAFDLDGKVLEVNDNFLEVMGYRREEVVGQHHRLFVPAGEADAPDYRAFWDRLRGGEFQAAEYRRIGKGGREVWIRATYNPIMGGDGRPTKVVKFAMDVTAEKRRIADQDGQMAAINRTQAIIAFDLSGHILDANENFLKATGYRRDEVIGKHHRIFVEPHYGESEDYRSFWTRLRNGEAIAAIYQRFNKVGKPIWLQATYNPILDALGRPVKIVKYATDITASMDARSRAVDAAEDTLNNVENVASAAEEMNATVGEIAGHMVRTKQVVDDIHARTGAADRSTNEMRQAAQAMTGVVQLIADVAGQINLLALNATIESARAGEAGRGFAVVANEVKILAGQTSAATTRIGNEITAMQSLSDDVVGALASITSAVGDVREYVDDVTRSIQEQSAVTQEIASNMYVAAGGVANIGRNLDDWIIGMEERRFEARVRTAKQAVILTQDGRRFACSVRNMSNSGAKLIVNGNMAVPDRFDLDIPEDGVRRRCEVARHGKGDIGVRFTDQLAQAVRISAVS